MIFFLECKPDEMLAKTLGIARKSIIHCNDKGDVCKHLCKSEQRKGMIDEDPMSAQPKYLKELKEQESVYRIGHFIDPVRSHKIIVLCPRLEEWFIEACKNKKGRIDITTFNLPDNPNTLHEIINFRLDNFQKAVQKLVELKNPAILHLQSLLLSE